MDAQSELFSKIWFEGKKYLSLAVRRWRDCLVLEITLQGDKVSSFVSGLKHFAQQTQMCKSTLRGIDKRMDGRGNKEKVS